MTASMLILLGIAFLIHYRLGAVVLIFLGLGGGVLNQILAFIHGLLSKL